MLAGPGRWLYLPRMSYRRHDRPDWGVAITSLVAVPLALSWAVICLVGGTMSCENEAAHCAGVFWPLLTGIVVIVGGAAVLGWGINLIVARIARGD